MSTTVDSIHDRCLESCAAFARQLALPGISGAYARLQYDESAQEMPAIVCTPEGEIEEEPDSGGWETVDIWFPVRWYLAVRIEPNNEPMRKTVLGWRERLVGGHGELRKLGCLEGVPESKDTRIKFGVVIDPKLPQYQSVLSAFTLQVLCRTIKAAEDNRVSVDPFQ
jgi:hypothetical protein